MPSATDTAEKRFRAAFERLKAGKPVVLPPEAFVSQNNVAKEAGTDPTALRKARYPALIRDIQAYVEIAAQERAEQKERHARHKRHRENLKTKSKKFEVQRDLAQSELVSAQRIVLELLQENAMLKNRLNDLLPPPTPLRK